MRTVLAGIVATLLPLAPTARADAPVTLKIVGGLAGVSQFKGFEQPFWEREIATLSAGRVAATIHAFDRSGIRAQDMLQLMKTGVVPFGNAILSIAASDTPELQGVDLPGLNPDYDTLRRNIEAYRPTLKTVLREAYNVELLGVYSHPAQVLFCARPFEGLHALRGLRVGTSSLPQSEMVAALGAVPAILPFNEQVDAVRRKSVTCAISGILSGHESGLASATTHVHAQVISWGVSIFGANRAAWDNLPAQARETIASGVRILEERIMRAAEADTRDGFECSLGTHACPVVAARRHVIVAAKRESLDAAAQIVNDMLLPQWIERCGAACEAIVLNGLLPSLWKTSPGIQSAAGMAGGSSN